GRIYSLQEVGERMQMSREGVRQIEVRALKKLQEAVAGAGATADDYIAT
ncbi:MAG: hypothetical protein C4321_07085, partial [Chloroflexota bacterium]